MAARYDQEAPSVPEVSDQMLLDFEVSPAELAASERVHRWYDYVQGFDPALVVAKIEERVAREQGVVLDPFCGSGTTLVAAQMLSHRAIGIDANPVMRLVSEGKTTWDVPLARLKAAGRQALEQLKDTSHQDAEQSALDAGIPMKSVNKWFIPENLGGVLQMRQILSGMDHVGQRVKLLLHMVYAKAMFDSSQVSMCPGITFVKRPRPPLRTTFRRRLDMVLADLKLLRNLGLHKNPKARVLEGDARDLGTTVENDSVDLILTSPPYPTDIEYTRQTRAELYFLGFIEDMSDVRAIKERMVRGSPKNIYKADNNERLIAQYKSIFSVSDAIADVLRDKNWGWDYARMVREYFGDMLKCLREAHRVLLPGGWALLVVGDQTCKGIMIPVTEILLELGADTGFTGQAVEQVRERRSTTHSMSLPESILALRKAG